MTVTDITINPPHPVLGEPVNYTAVDGAPKAEKYAWDYQYLEGTCGPGKWWPAGAGQTIQYFENKPGRWNMRVTATYPIYLGGSKTQLVKFVKIDPPTHVTIIAGAGPNHRMAQIEVKFRVDADARPCGPYLTGITAETKFKDHWSLLAQSPPGNTEWAAIAMNRVLNESVVCISSVHGQFTDDATWATIPNNTAYEKVTQEFRLKYTDSCGDVVYIPLDQMRLARTKSGSDWTLSTY